MENINKEISDIKIQLKEIYEKDKEDRILIIDGEMYKILNYKHFGDGKRGIYLHKYFGKDVSKMFERCHMTNEPWEILDDVRKGKHDQIKHLGPVTEERQKLQARLCELYELKKEIKN